MVRDPLSRTVVGVTGFEPATSCSQSRRATKLRYTPLVLLPSYTSSMERANIYFLIPLYVFGMVAMDLADGTVTWNSPSHPWWAVALFFAAALALLWLSLDTTPSRPLTRLNTSLIGVLGYTLVGAFAASLVRSALRTRLDVDTVIESLPVNVVAISAYVVALNVAVRALRPQKD